MTTRAQSLEEERRAMEAEKRIGDILTELSHRQEMFQKQSQEQRQEAKAQVARTEARFDELLQMITAMSIQNRARIPEVVTGNEGEVQTNPNGKSNWGKSTRLEFPKFDGEGFDGWLMRAEYFFEVADVPEKERVRIAALHLENKALQWHRGFVGLKGEKAYEEWDSYIKAIAARFGAQAYEDPLADLRNLKQVSSLQDYMDAFDELCPRTGIREDQALSFFLSGLIDELQMPVRMFKPKSLAEAYALAKLQELTVMALQNKPKSVLASNFPTSYSSSPKPLSVTTSNTKSNQPVGGTREISRASTGIPSFKEGAHNFKAGPRVTSKEMDERRAKGLCFWCEEKYTPNHRCPKRKVYVMQLIEEVDGGEDDDCLGEGNEESPSELQLSLHAMWGLEGAQTMRVKGECQGRSLRVLIDSGSTHNFLSKRVISKLKCDLTQVISAAVEVANGQQLQCTQKCKGFEWEMQGILFKAEVHVILLETYDLILGVQWLSTLGDISWNFNTLQMTFQTAGIQHTLKGERESSKEKQINCLSLYSQQMKWEEGKQEDEIKMSKIQVAEKGILPSCYNMQQEEQNWPEMEQLLADYAELFEEPSALPPKRLQDHKIILKEGAEPINIRPYKYASHQKDAIEEMIKDMLQSGVIRHSCSPYASPIVLVKKKDHSWRMCVDYRALNSITIKDKYPIPVIEELLDELGKASWFSKIDLRSGYWQVRMAPEDVAKTAFKSHEGHYEFMVMPFGLTNVPATFQNLMNSVFRLFLRKFILVFFDDILVYSCSKEEHIQHLDMVLQLMRDHKLLAKRSKCTFGCREIEYLGHIISEKGVATDEKKIEAVTAWPTPRSAKQVRSFLGLTGYYRRFVKGYGMIARPLIELMKEPKFQWTETAQAAFEKLKDAMTSAPVLVLPDFAKDFTLETDASGGGIGAVLMQGGHPIAFISKSLSPKHQLLSAYERELFAILFAVKKWYHYLQARKFFILTDHQSLKYLLEQKLTTPTQQAWMSKLMQFDYEIKYKKGIDNSVADALSRIPEKSVLQLISFMVPVELVQLIKDSWNSDPQMQQVIQEKQACEDSHPKYKWQNGELRRKGRLVVGNDLNLKAKILSIFHESSMAGHSGVLATYKRLSTLLYWPKLKKDVKEFIRLCVTCQRFKADNTAPAGLLQPLPTPTSIFTDLTMDFIEALPLSQGKNAILVVVDRLSKYAHFMAMSHPLTARKVAEVFLNEVFRLHGMPNTLTSDRGAVFVSAFWRELLALQGVQLQHSTAYHPQSDGQSEVVNRCLQCYLRCAMSERPNSWVQWLPLAEYWYNTTYHSSIKMSPFEALYGFVPPIHIPYLAGDSNVAAVDIFLRDREASIQMLKANLEKAAARMKHQADKHRVDRHYEIGDWVLLKLQVYRQTSIRGSHHKFEPKFYGPYQVLDKIGEVAYKLNLPPSAMIHNVFHVSQLRASSPPTGPIPDFPSVSHINDDFPQAVLERRMVKRHNKATAQWLIHWAHKSPADASWEFAEEIQARFPSFLADKEG